QAQGGLPVGRGASNPAANGRVERQILRRWLPDETEQRRVVGALVLNVFPVDFASDAQSRMHGPFANDAPYPEPVSVISIEPAATVHVHGDRPDRGADDGRGLDAHAVLTRQRRWQQRPAFNRPTEARFPLS